VGDLDRNGKVQPNVDLTALYSDIDEFEKAGKDLNAAVASGLASGRLSAAHARRLNQQLMQVELNWLAEQGIPGRPWFKHLLYAARYTYAHLELPGLTEAAEKADWKTAKEQLGLLEAAIKKNTELLRAAKTEMEKSN